MKGETSSLRPGEDSTVPGSRSADSAPDLRASSLRHSWLAWLLPLVITGIGALGMLLLASLRPPVEPLPAKILAPLVRVAIVESKPVQLVVHTQGTVAPRTESRLVPEVSGRVTWVSPALAAGGFFEADEPLLRLDDRDQRVAAEQAAAASSRQQAELELASRTRERAETLNQRGVMGEAQLDEAHSRERVARAALAEARALLRRAQLDLERSELRAPFAGRVREKLVDVGEFVTRGAPVARLYAVDYAELRLPIQSGDLAHLELPLDYRGEATAGPGPLVDLRADMAGREHRWQGRIVRTEGEIDPRSRMIHVVARVDDPYGRDPEYPGRPPLAVGLFVRAEIRGRSLSDAVVVPRSALRDENHVLVVDAEQRLYSRRVEVIQRDRETVVIGAGLSPGEALCISSPEAITEGMKVRTRTESPSES